MKLRHVAALVLPLAALFPTGCGGDEEPPPPAQQEPTRLDLAQQEKKDLDAKLLAAYKTLSEVLDEAERERQTAEIRVMEERRKVLDAEIAALYRQAREEKASEPK